MVNNFYIKSILALSLIVFLGSFTSCSKRESNLNSADTNKVKKDSLKNSSENHIKTDKTFFTCGDKEFSVKQNGDIALITIDINGTLYKDHELKLNPAETSGSKYSDGKLTFWQKGNRCIVQYENKNIYEDCIEKNSK